MSRLMGSLSQAPWHYIKHMDDSPGYYRIYRTAKETDLICKISSEANAAHIVKCVNMHEELRTALQNLLDRRCEDHVRAAQEVLAKAEGRE